MSKRYQVFVSSTFTDLQLERAEVMQALLELDCMPAGMELFPAANEEQWNWIKKVIDESDYYIVILAGRYGTIAPSTGMSYTEMEYHYALESGKPVMAFLHENPTKIEAGKTESSTQAKKKLTYFRKFLEQKLCKYFANPADLGAKVSRSMTQLIKHQPAVGWVRADALREGNSTELVALKAEIERLKEELDRARSKMARTTPELAQGDDPVEINFTYVMEIPKLNKRGIRYWAQGHSLTASVRTTWDLIFSHLSGDFANGRNHSLGWSLRQHVVGLAESSALANESGEKLRYLTVNPDDVAMVALQFQALGLIVEENGKGSWSLTRAGHERMISLKAVHRDDHASGPVSS